MRIARAFGLCLFLTMSAGVVRGERKYVIGSQYDFLLAGTNYGGFSSSQASGMGPLIGFYPSIDLKSTGRNNELTMAYTALGERFYGDPGFKSLAHVVTGDLATRVSRSLSFGFAGSFSNAPDYTSVDVIRGAAPSPDTFRFPFQPSLAKSISQTYRGAFNSKIELNYRSFITIDVSALSVNYQQQRDIPGNLLSDQTRQEGRVGYWRNLDSHQSIDVQYVFVRNDYSGSGIGRTQGAVIGYTRQLSPALKAHFEAGPAFTVFGISNSYGFFASASVMRTIHSSQISATYLHSPGDSSGLGSSLSNVDSIGFSVFSPLWKRLSIASSTLGFSSRSEISGSTDNSGIYSSVDLSYPLSKRWFVTGGGSYRLNRYTTSHDQEYKRLYISLRFRAPELWRTSL